MKTFLARSFLIAVLGICGCQATIIMPDLTPPSPPRGISTATGDHFVEIFWLANPEADVAGYKIYSSSTAQGRFTFIASTGQPHFVDAGIQNGVTYYYAVSAYDFDGNESDPSADIAYDTPRPEGYDVQIADYRRNPGSAGYDFSTYSVGNYDDQYTDLFFENFNGTFYLNVWDDSNIRDMGYTASVYDIAYAPADGWSPTKDARVYPGHTYAVQTWDNHYAKVRVINVSLAGVNFDWVYQLQEGNPRLKQAVSHRSPLLYGPGFAGRRTASLP